MKVLFVVPPAQLQERYGRLKGAGAIYPSIGIAYLAAGLMQLGHEVRVLDAEVLGVGLEAIRAETESFNPDLAGFQTYCANLARCMECAQLIRSIKSDVRVVFGGVQATLFPEQSLANENVDFVVRGEGDRVLPELVRCLEAGTEPVAVRGLSWRRNGAVIHNPNQDLIHNLDELPHPALHLFPHARYRSSAQLRGRKTMLIFTSRGCPYNCSYCSGDLIFGKSFRFHGTEWVMNEIDRLTGEFKVDSLQFYDETFTIDRERIIELCQAMIDRNLNLPWSCFTRVDLVDLELLKMMKKAGCYQIFFGVETGVERLLTLIRKGTTLDQAREAFRLTHQVGIETVASFMLTLPTETIEETWISVRFGLELDPDYVYWLTFTPYPGTDLAEFAARNGTIINTDYSSYNVFDSIAFLPLQRTEQEIRETITRAYRMFYFRPSYMLRRLRSILKLPPVKIWSLMHGALLTFLRRRM